MHRDWVAHRRKYVKGQIVIRWREYTVKQKLARMFFKKMVLLRFKNYTFQKTHAIPYQFWSRYRQILFFKILKYHTRKSKRRHMKANIVSEKQKDYRDKLLKKAYVGLLENAYNSKKKKTRRHGHRFPPRSYRHRRRLCQHPPHRRLLLGIVQLWRAIRWPT